jgi:hypothetical protein
MLVAPSRIEVARQIRTVPRSHQPGPFRRGTTVFNAAAPDGCRPRPGRSGAC